MASGSRFEHVDGMLAGAVQRLRNLRRPLHRVCNPPLPCYILSCMAAVNSRIACLSGLPFTFGEEPLISAFHQIGSISPNVDNTCHH